MSQTLLVISICGMLVSGGWLLLGYPIVARRRLRRLPVDASPIQRQRLSISIAANVAIGLQFIFLALALAEGVVYKGDPVLANLLLVGAVAWCIIGVALYIRMGWLPQRGDGAP